MSGQKPKYTRAAPSPRYQRLIEQYRTLHMEGERFLKLPPERTFDGASLPAQAQRIKALITRTGAATILDYGSGKGKQYLQRRFADPVARIEYPDIRSYWGVESIRCYDPGYAPYAELPSDQFDGVISTDVLEHCFEEDVPWIIEELFSFARKFVFANVACYPAKKRLPSGSNAHCTIKAPSWWGEHVQRAAELHPGILYEVRTQAVKETPAGQKLVERAMTNIPVEKQ